MRGASLSEFEGRAKILCLGDSITEQGWGTKGGLGWVSLLSNAYSRKADVCNRGFGGYTTRTLAPIAARLLDESPPSSPSFLLVTLFLGANDSNSQPEQHVPLEEYCTRLTGLVKAAAAVSKCVLCIAPGPVDNRRWPSRSNAAVAAYNAAAFVACAAARLEGCGATILFASLYAEATATSPVPPFAAVAEGSDITPAGKPPAQYLDHLSDGLHLSSWGNQSLFHLILKTIEAGCPEVLPHALPYDFPAWMNIQVDAGELASQAFTPEALVAFREKH